MQGNIRRMLAVAIVLILAGAAVAVYYFNRDATKTDGTITASGTVEAVEVIISPELSGRVSDVLVSQGDTVSAGQPLLKLDDTLLQTQRKQAEAGKVSAQAGLDTARTALETARLQYQQILETARLADSPARSDAWGLPQPAEFDLPNWYFSKQEQIRAMEAEVEAAHQALETEQQSLQTLLADPDYSGLLAAEQRVAQARAAFLTAKDVLDHANTVGGTAELRDAAQEQYDDAKRELEDAQKDYDDLLKTDQGKELLKARARVRAAGERYYDALDRLARLHTGEDSDAVKIAAAVVLQAEATATQAEKVVAQAQSQLDLIDAQITKLTVVAPVAGTVIERNVEPGEMVVAGSTALVLGRLDKLTITVYVPEDRYGEIRLGEPVEFTVDSFPGKTFSGSVSRIADRSEFTPRNVQTAEGRRTTVFAVEITVDNPTRDLKPGMPADVTFKP